MNPESLVGLSRTWTEDAGSVYRLDKVLRYGDGDTIAKKHARRTRRRKSHKQSVEKTMGVVMEALAENNRAILDEATDVMTRLADFRESTKQRVLSDDEKSEVQSIYDDFIQYT
jgi:pyridoxal/pyridoxine/pyridoxamine kinase